MIASTTPAVSTVLPVTEAGPVKNGMKPEVVLEPLLHRDQVRGQRPGAPEAEDDRGYGGQQVDHVGDRHGQRLRRVVRDEQRDAQRERHGDDQRDERGEDGAEEQPADVGPEAVERGVVAGRLVDAGDALDGEEDEDRRQRRQDDQPGAAGQAREDPVAALGRWADLGLGLGGGGHAAPGRDRVGAGGSGTALRRADGGRLAASRISWKLLEPYLIASMIPAASSASAESSGAEPAWSAAACWPSSDTM